MMHLSYEDAYFYYLLLRGGFNKEVNEWIYSITINNEVFYGICLDVLWYQNKINEIISVLHNYIGSNQIDDNIVCDKLRLLLKEKLNKRELSYNEVANSLYRFSIDSEKWQEKPWNDFYMLNVYGDYIDGGYFEKEDYCEIVKMFVNEGVLLNPDDFLKTKRKN